MSTALEPLLAGTSAFAALDRSAPTGLLADAERTIAIDCDTPADEHWVLAHRDADTDLRDELGDRVAVLTEALATAR